MLRRALPLISSLLLGFSVAGSTARASIGPADRDLVAIVNLSLLKKFKPLYQYEENRAIAKIKRDLRGKYREIHILSGHHATHAEFLRALATADADPAVKAIDAIVYIHGHPGELGFVDTGFYPMDRLRDEILAQAPAGPASTKLRALYSDACYGASHMQDWLRAGFRVVTGSTGSDSNWSLDLGKFMRDWRRGRTFAMAIRSANSVWATKWMDKIEGGNSFKETAGNVDFRIDDSVESISKTQDVL